MKYKQLLLFTFLFFTTNYLLAQQEMKKTQSEFSDSVKVSIPNETNNSLGMEFILVEGGSFDMGEGDAKHHVTLKDFYIGKYEVTVAEFKKFIDATNYQTDADKESSSYVLTESMVEKRNGVNWHIRYDGQCVGVV